MKPLSIVYHGIRTRCEHDTCDVYDVMVDEHDDRLRPLSPAPSLLVRARSMLFAWGNPYESSAQLSLALLLDFTGSASIALKHHEDFKWRLITGLGGRNIAITGAAIAAFLLERGVDQAALEQRGQEHHG